MTGKVHEITFKILPEISDSKSAQYQDEPVIGRSFPVKTYSHSENRVISTKLHFVVLTHEDAYRNMLHLRAIQSASYPREGDRDRPYLPPPICQIKVGRLLAADFLCVVLKSYNVSYPIDVVWYDVPEMLNVPGAVSSYIPYKFSIDCTWDVVYPNERLPGQESILRDF